MARNWLSEEEFIQKYVPHKKDASPKSIKTAFRRRKAMCMETEYRDAFICPWKGETYIDEDRYQQFLIFVSESKFKNDIEAARTAAKF